MDDPFLLAHLVRPFFFDIGGKISPISIRDQMIRGRMIIDRACERGLLGSNSTYRDSLDDRLARPPNRLLIIGAGAAGVTAAVRAAQRGIETTLIDVASGPFSRQAGCSSRWVDPTQYDWPVDHWDRSNYHWKPPVMPLQWSAHRAHQLAITWGRQFNLARIKHKRFLRVLYGTTASNFHFGVPPARPRVSVDLHLPRGVIPAASFDLVVSCIGFGTERSSVPLNYSSFRFWDTDKFEHHDLGLPHLNQPRVVISGGGDGALQDFLRIVTGFKSAKEICLALSTSAKNAIEATLQSAEDQAQRAYIWGYYPLHDHEVHGALHEAHRDAVDELWNNSSFRGALSKQLDGLIRPSILNNDLRVTLVHPCSHFSNCYGLNRFLVLLLAKYLTEKYNINTLRSYTGILEVKGCHHHICNNHAASCYGREHEVTFCDLDCSVRPGQEEALRPPEIFDVVVIRHGITAPTFNVRIGKKVVQRKSNPRQILPYHAAS